MENSYYHQTEVMIYLENTNDIKGDNKKVAEYKLIDGTTVTDAKNLYDEGTVKIRKGDCIAWVQPVEAAYNGVACPFDEPVKK